MAELNVPAPPSPSVHDSLRTQFNILDLKQKQEKLSKTCAELECRRDQQKKQKKFWRVILESKIAGAPQFSGKEIFTQVSTRIMELLNVKNFDDQKVKERCFEFSLPADRVLDKKQRKFPINMKSEKQTYPFNCIIVPSTYYRIVLTGPGVNLQSKALLQIAEMAWTTSTSAQSLEQLNKNEKLSCTCFFVTSKVRVPPQMLLTFFATSAMSKAGIYARWTQPEICTLCGSAGHSSALCAFDGCPEEAEWMFDLTSKHAKYHERQLESIWKRMAKRVLMSSQLDSNPPPLPSSVSPAQLTPPSTLAPPSVPSTSSPKETSPGITQGTTTQSTTSINQSTAPTTVPPPIPTQPQDSWTYAEVVQRYRTDFPSRTPTKDLPVDPSLRRSSLADTIEKIAEKTLKEARERWNLSKSTTQNKPQRTDQPSSSLSSSSSLATHLDHDSQLLAGPGGPSESSSL